MEIQVVTTLVATLAVLTASSILTVGTITLINNLSLVAFGRTASYNEINESLTGAPVYNVTHPLRLVGRTARCTRWLVGYVPYFLLLSYVCTALVFIGMPLSIVYLGGHHVGSDGIFVLKYTKGIPEILWNTDQSIDWGKWYLFTFGTYCVTCVLSVGIIKIFLSSSRKEAVSRNFIYAPNINL